MRFLLVTLLTFGVVGCGSQVTMKEPATAVSGKLSRAGQPLGSLMIIFQPLGDGHVQELQVRQDGTFQGEFVSGDYAYYVGKPAAVSSTRTLKGISPEYFQPKMSRTVTIQPGQPLAIALD